MGRNAVITYEDVAACADALQQIGVTPSVRKVTKKLGTTASYTTIGRLLKQWKKTQPQHPKTARQISPQLEQALMKYVDNELAAAQKELQDELAQLEQEADDFLVENMRQAEQLESLNAELDKFRNEKAGAEGRVAELEKQVGSLRDDLAQEREAAEKTRTDLVAAETRLEYMREVEQQLEAVRAERDRERDGRAVAERDLAVLVIRKEELERRLAEGRGSVLMGAGEEANR